MRSHRLSTLAGALAAMAWSTSAAAQGLPLDRFDPAPAGDRMFGVESPFVAGHLTPHVMLLADYAHNPLVLRTTNGDKNVGSVVSSQLYLHGNISFALWERLNLNLDIPGAVLQTGDSPSGGGATVVSPSKAQFGDLRAGLRFRILGDYHDAFQLAVGGYVWFPTGPSHVGSFVGDGKVRGLPELILGGRTDRIVWSLAGGPRISAADQIANVEQGTMIKVGGGLGILLGDERQLQIGPEFSLGVATSGLFKRTVNSEVLLDVRYRFLHDFEIGAGAGPGLSGGVGTPDFRGVAMFAYTPEMKADRDHDGIVDREDACPDEPGPRNDDPKKNGCPERDRDGDGILDDVDACPDEPGVPSDDPKKNGCPVRDRDGDKILDDVDACPDEPGVPSEDPKKHGCPVRDRDGDGIPDDVDACPDVKGVADADPKKNGCPPPVDTDGDGIFDDVDACPNEKGQADPDPKKNGCPTVHVTETEIVILEQVQFDTGKATIKKVSDPLLDKVAAVFKEHTQILKVEVQGHTDNRGSAAFNKKLSADRADAVKKALMKRGIMGARLTAKGYGQDVPIADNNSEDGRQQNRRVQFKIIDKGKKGEAPPPPPPGQPKAPKAHKGAKKK